MKQSDGSIPFLHHVCHGQSAPRDRLPAACGDEHAHFDVKTEKTRARRPRRLRREKRELSSSAASMRRDASDAAISHRASPSMAHGLERPRAIPTLCSMLRPARTMSAPIGSRSPRPPERTWALLHSPQTPGQTYFFEAKIVPTAEGPSDPPTIRTHWVLDLKQLSDDKG